MSAKKKSERRYALRPVVGGRYSQKDIDAIGPVLIEIADRHAVDIPQLTTKQVYDEVSKNKRHILWKYLNVDPSKAMRSWIMSQLDSLMSSVRVVYADLPSVKPQALFMSVSDTSRAGDGGTGRAKVSSIHARDESGISERIASGMVNRLRQEVSRLEALSAGTHLPPHYRLLLSEALASLDKFERADGKQDVAAE
jgi:hypothetical protein